MKRVVKPEWLDELPAHDPRAARSRRDIQRLNLLMGHHRIVAQILSKTFSGRAPRNLVEIGGGGGEFLLSVARQLENRWQKAEATLVDRADVCDSQTRGEFSVLGWNTKVEVADALAWLRQCRAGKFEAIV